MIDADDRRQEGANTGHCQAAQRAGYDRCTELHRHLAACRARQLVDDQFGQCRRRDDVRREPETEKREPGPVEVEPTEISGPAHDSGSRHRPQARDDPQIRNARRKITIAIAALG